MNKFLYRFSLSIIILFLINIIGYLAIRSDRYATRNIFEKVYYSFFHLGDRFVMYFKTVDERFLDNDETGFISLKDTSIKVYCTNAFYNDEDSKWQIDLLKVGSLEPLYSWSISNNAFDLNGKKFSHSVIRSPLMLRDTSLIFFLDETNNLFRIDKSSKIVWHNKDHTYHHTFNKMNDSFIWVCATDFRNAFSNNSLVKIDINMGTTVSEVSLADIFLKNRLNYYFAMGNAVKNSGTDPFHLNDVEVCENNTEFWMKGDLFLSLRHRSAIVHYRPSNDSLINIISGPFMNQHDVDIVNDSCIRVFDNHVTAMNNYEEFFKFEERKKFSGLVEYNMNNGKFSNPFNKQMELNLIFTETEGLHQDLGGSKVFIEEQNSGIIYIIGLNKLYYKGYLNNNNSKFGLQHTNWPRIYKNNPLSRP